MKQLIALPLLLATLGAGAYGGDPGPGPAGNGGEPPGGPMDGSFAQQSQCVTVNDDAFVWEFVPELRCGIRLPPWAPAPPLVKPPIPAVPEPSSWMLALIGAGMLWLRRRVMP